jgi:CubicO group peptidase (beta-lactamase class C family)
MTTRCMMKAKMDEGLKLMSKARRWIACLTLLLGSWAHATEPASGKTAELGFSSARLDYIDQFYAAKVNKGELAGVVTLIARHGKIVHFSAVGYADVERKQKMQRDTIFRLYSMTKPIASTALMMLYEEGRFQMQDPLSKYIPEFANLRVLRKTGAALGDTVPLVRPPTVQDVMRHTAGFSHGLGGAQLDAAYDREGVFGLDVSLSEMMSKLAKIPLLEQPGKRFIYSVGPDIQARLVEVLSGMSFAEFLEKRLFHPLGMRDAGFSVPADSVGRLSAIHWSKDGKLTTLDETHGYPSGGGVLVQPWSANSYTVKHKHTGGSFGLVSTAEDYWRFAQMMLNGGEFNGIRILSPQTVKYMSRDHLGKIGIEGPNDEPIGIGFGLGFAVMKDPGAAGYMSSEGTYFWAGAAGTQFWIDPKEDLVVVAMIQHMATPDVDSFSPQIRSLVYSALLN